MKLFSFRRLFVFGAGAAAGYFAGSREGRRQAESLARQAQEFWTSPKTQQQIHDVTSRVSETVKEKAPQLSDAVDKAAGYVDKSTGFDSEDSEPKHAQDVVSDPETDMDSEGPANNA